MNNLQDTLKAIRPYVLGWIDTVPWTDYSAASTIVGWSSFTTKEIYYRRVGKLLFCHYFLEGTSNSTSATFTLPYLSLLSINVPCLARNNGAVISTALAYAGNPTVQFYTDFTGAAWTASGTKTVRGQFFFEVYTP